MNEDLMGRVARLEERLAWFEKHAVEQDRAMLELAREVERLREEVARIGAGERDGRDGQAERGGQAERDRREPDERPPHY